MPWDLDRLTDREIETYLSALDQIIESNKG